MRVLPRQIPRPTAGNDQYVIERPSSRANIR